MSQMPETAKKSDHILSEVRRVLEENGVLESRSPMAVLQEQFDAAISQRDELLNKVVALELKVLEMEQSIANAELIKPKEKYEIQCVPAGMIPSLSLSCSRQLQSVVNDLCAYFWKNKRP